MAFNFGNAIGSIVGGAMLTSFSMNYRFTGLGGVPLTLLAVGLLTFYSWRGETDAEAIHACAKSRSTETKLTAYSLTCLCTVLIDWNQTRFREVSRG